MKVDVAELVETQQLLNTARNKIQAQIESAKTALRVIAESDELSGKVKTAINGDIVNHQLPLLTNYYDTVFFIANEFTKHIEKFKTTVEEGNPTAKIDSAAILTIEKQFQGKEEGVVAASKMANDVYASIDDIIDISAVTSKSFGTQAKQAKKVLTNTRKWLQFFNDQKESTKISDLLAQQNKELTQLNGTSSVGYTSSAALTIFNGTDFRKTIKAQHKKASQVEKMAFKKEHPVLGMIDGSMDNTTIAKIDALLNSPVVKFMKEHSGDTKREIADLKKILVGARITRLSDKSVIIQEAKGIWAKIDKLTGLDGLLKEGKSFTRLSTSGKIGSLNKIGKNLLSDLNIFDGNSVFKRPFKESLKSIGRITAKEMGKSSLKSLKGAASFGVKGVVDDFKALKNAKGVAKSIPGVNLALGATDVVSGLGESERIAKKQGLRGNEVVASKVGGVAVDVAKTAATTAVIGVATGLAATAGAPIVAVAATGVVAATALNYFDKKTGFTKKAKSAVNSLVKGVSGWFK